MTITIHGDDHFSTPRLELYLISREELIGLRPCPTPTDIFMHRPFTNFFGILTQENLPREDRILDVEHNPANLKWYYRLIVHRDTAELIGSISFHAPPDEFGMVEIGFGIHEEFRNRGYGKEALNAMFTWACEQPQVKTLRYSVAQTNAPSQAIIQSLNFTHKGVQIDDEDGPEDIYEMSAEEYVNRFVAMS